MNDVLIEVKGGLIQNIYANDVRINVRVIDYDNIDCGDELDLTPWVVAYTHNSLEISLQIILL